MPNKKLKKKKKGSLDSQSSSKENKCKTRTLDSSLSSSGSEEALLDTTSSFAQSATKGKYKANISSFASILPNSKKAAQVHVYGDNNSVEVKEAKQFAHQAMEQLKLSNYQNAILLLTKAIDKSPGDMRYLNNRSCIYEKLGQYKCSLDDAERMIFNNQFSAKGYLRKAKACEKMGKYLEADQAFGKMFDRKVKPDQVSLPYAQYCRREMVLDALVKLLNVTRFDAECAYVAYGGSLAKAEEGLRNNRDDLVQRADVYCSPIDPDEEEDIYDLVCCNTPSKSGSSNHLTGGDGRKWETSLDLEGLAAGSSSHDRSMSSDDWSSVDGGSLDIETVFTDPKNVLRTASIWVGNIPKHINEDSIRSLFQRVGPVENVHLCAGYAFINFRRWRDAGRAIEQFQGCSAFGSELHLRYPSNVPKEALLTDPSNKVGAKSLWIGNIATSVTQSGMEALFSRFGAVSSVAINTDKHSGFVNYADKDCASHAMIWLQGFVFHGAPLFIKFPYAAIQNKS